jgi:cysteine desulfurase
LVSALLKWEPVPHSYFDHNATTPLAPEVRETLVECLDQVYGNASSIHQFGQAARKRLEAARRQVAALVHADAAEVVFTSGGTEADNMAVLGVARFAPSGAARHVITTAIEHPAVLAACAQLEREGVAVTRVKVGASGVVNPDDVRAAVRPETVLISVMHANNELGTIQPIVEIGRIARQAAIPFHVDGVQALGKIPVDVAALGADLYSMSGHKLCAPKGVGALYVRKGCRLAPLLFGGHQERERRPGTENVPACVAFGAAAELAARNLAADAERIAALRDRFESAVLGRVSGARINGSRWGRLPNTSNLHIEGVDGEALVIALDLRGFAVSTGAACSSGAIAPSHVLTAIGLGAEGARSSLRVSLGRTNTAAEVDALAAALEAAVAHLRRVAVHA